MHVLMKGKKWEIIKSLINELIFEKHIRLLG